MGYLIRENFGFSRGLGLGVMLKQQAYPYS